MSLPARFTNFVTGTKIFASDMNSELNQLIDWLSGVSTTVEFIFKRSSTTIPPLTLDQTNTSGPILDGKIAGALRAQIEKDGHYRQRYGATAFGTAPTLANINITQVPDVGTSETDLYNVSLEADTFKIDGDGIRVVLFGTLSGSTGKRIRFYFGPTLVFDTQTYIADLTGTYWKLTIELFRTASNVSTHIEKYESDTATYMNAGNVTEDLTDGAVFRVTGQDTSGSPGIIKNAAYIERLAIR
jgi:hypothetical protein